MNKPRTPLATCSEGPIRYGPDPYNNTLRIKVILVDIHEIAVRWLALTMERWRYVDRVLIENGGAQQTHGYWSHY
ncbi:hypothetical protein N7481_011140 [Penicillium waksmanii]|uniref:uncharacterized protein n=1 Tax=Penicillium waksmanii TaxID=69791 RepID=UPI002549BC4A|nr:uncharacterized protein N7481_011140 [Penicillium waksmanii]KAJ5973930.1 hypothetical protein N7481_011140 [Penicillium waksmanii]